MIDFVEEESKTDDDFNDRLMNLQDQESKIN